MACQQVLDLGSCLGHEHAQACGTRSCEGAARFLRRAAELVSGMEGSLKVPGLCSEVVAFLQAHPSNAYDAIALRVSCGMAKTWL